MNRLSTRRAVPATAAIIPVLCAIGATMLGTPSAVATSPTTTNTIADPAAMALAHDQSVSLSEAARRIARQADQSAFVVALQARYPDSYAGSWVDQRDGGKLISRFTTDPANFAGLVSRYHLGGNAALGARATYSLAQLEQAQTSTLARRSKLEPVSTSLDLVNNQVLFHSKAPIAKSMQAAASSVNATGSTMIRFDSNYHAAIPLSACGHNASWEVGCTQPIRGGQQIADETYGQKCTLGFNVTSRSDGKRYVLTDGHCVDGEPLNDTMPWTALNNVGSRGPFGQVHSEKFYSPQGSADWALIRVSNGISSEPDVYVQASTDNAGRNTVEDENYAITGVGGTVVNQYYCKTGGSGGTGCGQVLETGVGNQVDSTHYVTNMAFIAQSAVYGPGSYRLACQGDSGGPVYSGHLGYGLVESGAAGSEYGTSPNGAVCFFDYYYTGLTGALNGMNVDLSTP